MKHSSKEYKYIKLNIQIKCLIKIKENDFNYQN